MDRTVAHLNIDHYRRLLATETDEARRQVLLKQQAEEERKLAESAASSPNAKPNPKPLAG